MHHQEVAPPVALWDNIQCIWYDRLDFGDRPASFEVSPDGYAEIIFHVGSACHLATPTGWRPLPSPFLMGLLQQPARLSTQGRFEIIGIRCFPWTVFGLLPVHGNVPLGEHPIAQLQAPLAQCLQAGNVAAALAQAAHYFGQVRSRLAGESLLGKAGRAMWHATGTLPVSQVAAAAHTTVRTLERTFKQAAGRTVKDVSSLMRFEQVRNHLLLHPAPIWPTWRNTWAMPTKATSTGSSSATAARRPPPSPEKLGAKDNPRVPILSRLSKRSPRPGGNFALLIQSPKPCY